MVKKKSQPKLNNIIISVTSHTPAVTDFLPNDKITLKCLMCKSGWNYKILIHLSENNITFCLQNWSPHDKSWSYNIRINSTFLKIFSTYVQYMSLDGGHPVFKWNWYIDLNFIKFTSLHYSEF